MIWTTTSTIPVNQHLSAYNSTDYTNWVISATTIILHFSWYLSPFIDEIFTKTNRHWKATRGHSSRFGSWKRDQVDNWVCITLSKLLLRNFQLWLIQGSTLRSKSTLKLALTVVGLGNSCPVFVTGTIVWGKSFCWTNGVHLTSAKWSIALICTRGNSGGCFYR